MPHCELLDRPTAKESYKEAIGYAVEDISDRFKRLRLDGRPVEVKPWPGNDSLDVQRLHNALLDYDDDYNPEYRKSTDLKKMKRLYNLLGGPNHCQITDYTFELRVCGDPECKLCPNRGIRTPVTDDMELRKRVLGFLPLPIQDPTNEAKILSTEKAVAMVDGGMDRHEQLKSLSVLGEQNDEKILLKENREKDKKLTPAFFHFSKVRHIIWCGECGAPRAVCSMFGFGRDKGPTQVHKDTLQQRIEKGYMCGEALDVPPYNLREAHRCNDPVEPIYYATQDTRGGRIVTKDICAVCYGPDDLVLKQDLLESGHTKGKEPLPMCRDCFDSGMNLVFSAKATNFKIKGKEDKLNKEKKTGSSREKEKPKIMSRIIWKQMGLF